MTSIQIGMSKSGNLWFYNIMEKIYAARGLPFKSFIRTQPAYELMGKEDLAFPKQREIDHVSILPSRVIYRTGVHSAEEIRDVPAYLKNTTHVWLHTHWCRRSFSVLRYFDKIIYLFRDPRDMAISLSHYAFTPYRLKHFEHHEKDPATLLARHLHFIIASWAYHVTGYLRHRRRLNIYFIFYERLLHNFDQEMDLLTRFLDMPLSETQIKKIREELSFKSMRVDYPNHLRKGRAEGWRESLSPKQIDRVGLIAAPLLRDLGYPVRTEDPLDWKSLEVKPGLKNMRLAYIEWRAFLFRKFFSAKLKAFAHRAVSAE
ncbi:MAG: sulfotransferase domain-containing protein [Candidatus Omnitrophota bacterium]